MEVEAAVIGMRWVRPVRRRRSGGMGTRTR